MLSQSQLSVIFTYILYASQRLGPVREGEGGMGEGLDYEYWVLR